MPKTWAELTSGSILRVGKISFKVVFEELQSAGKHAVVAADAAAVGPQTMVTGAAWQEADIAEYLDTEDAADQERRYDAIRSGTQSMTDTIAGDGLPDLDDPDALVDDDQDTDTDIEAPEAEASAGTQARGKVETAPSTTKTKKVPKRFGKLPKKKKRPTGAGGGLFSDIERLKMIGAALLLVTTIGVLGYSGYRFFAGPEVRVIEGID